MKPRKTRLTKRVLRGLGHLRAQWITEMHSDGLTMFRAEAQNEGYRAVQWIDAVFEYVEKKDEGK